MSKERRYRDKAWLREQYAEKQRNTVEIAEECDCAPSTVGRWLKKFDIGVRSSNPVPDERLTEPAWLREQYVNQQHTTTMIAEECGCDPTTVNSWLNEHSIETRQQGGSPENQVPDERLADAEWLHEKYIENKLTTTEIADMCDCAGSTVGDWLKRHNIPTRDGGAQIVDSRLTDAEWLHEQYVEKEKKMAEIGELCDCGGGTISRWLKKHDIEARSKGGEGWNKWVRRAPDKRLTNEEWVRDHYSKRKWRVPKLLSCVKPANQQFKGG